MALVKALSDWNLVGYKFYQAHLGAKAYGEQYGSGYSLQLKYRSFPCSVLYTRCQLACRNCNPHLVHARSLALKKLQANSPASVRTKCAWVLSHDFRALVQKSSKEHCSKLSVLRSSLTRLGSPGPADR